MVQSEMVNGRIWIKYRYERTFINGLVREYEMSNHKFDFESKKGKVALEAVETFYLNGYHATGMRQIAEKVGVTVSNLYNFFPSKQDLLMHILEMVLNYLILEGEKLLKAFENTSSIEQLRQLMVHHIKFHGEYKKLAIISDSELRGLDEGHLKVVLELRKKYESLFSKTIQDGVEKGVMQSTNIKIDVYAILNMCTGVAYWYQKSGKSTLDEIGEQYFNLIKGGLQIKDSSK